MITKYFKGFIMEINWIYVSVGIIVLVGIVVVDIVLNIDSYSGKIYTKISNFMSFSTRGKKK